MEHALQVVKKTALSNRKIKTWGSTKVKSITRDEIDLAGAKSIYLVLV